MSSSDDQSGDLELKCFSFGRIVRTSDSDRPYKAILFHGDQSETGDPAEADRSFATMREAEAFIRKNTPRPRRRSTGWDARRA